MKCISQAIYAKNFAITDGGTNVHVNTRYLPMTYLAFMLF